MGYYLDNAATHPINKEVKDYIIELLDTYGNPSSLHSEGLKTRKVIEETRDIVAKFVNRYPSEIYFTPSGSAANTLAIEGYIKRNECDVFCLPTCHKSIIKTVQYHFGDINVHSLKVDKYGVIDFFDLEERLSKTEKNPFVIVDCANSEFGTIQPVGRISNVVHKHNGVIMADCTGIIPTMKLDLSVLDVDIATFSGHKLGALKGVGVLFKKNNIFLKPLIFGSQENGLCGGTENVLAIGSFGKAIETYPYDKITSFGRDLVWNYISDNIEDTYLIGSPQIRLANNLYVCFKGVSGEQLVTMLDDYDIQVSTGSACNNGSSTPSSSLLAIGIPEEDIHSCIRFSFKGDETEEELKYICERLKVCVDMLRRFAK